MARTFSGSQYLTLASGLSLGANDAVWMSGWFYRNNTANYAYFSLGVSGSANNRRFVSGSTVGVTSTSGTGGAGTATGSNPGNGAWFHILAEWGSASERAVRINGATRVADTTTATLAIAPDLTRIGATPTTTALLQGRAAYVALYSGAPTTQEGDYLSGLGVEANAYHPSLIASDRLLAYWDLDGTDDPEPDGVGSNDMTLVGSPGSTGSPSIILSGGPGGSSTNLSAGWWL